MPSPPPLQMGHHYHIFNRGNSGEDIFRETRNHLFFMQRFCASVHPVDVIELVAS